MCDVSLASHTRHSPSTQPLWRRIDLWLDEHWLPTLLVALSGIIRIPTFFEPYWYGDEGIYLTIGNGLRAGSHLYSQIIDHKTPLIYFFALVPGQFWFRFLMAAWMVVATLLMWCATKRLLSRGGALVSTLLFVLLTNWPGLEGNIPNGELFVMGFILAGLAVLAHSSWGSQLTGEAVAQKKPHWPLFAAGLLGSLGILTKVPGLFDVLVWYWVGWLSMSREFLAPVFSLEKWSRSAAVVVKHWGALTAGVLLPLVLSVVYFWLRGSFAEYLQFGLLYNFRYAGNWQLDITSPLLAAVFTLWGKAALTGVALLSITLAKDWLTPRLQFGLGWVWLALFASLLSNRPYPHYFLQLVPAVCMLAGILAYEWPRYKGKLLVGSLVAVALSAVWIKVVVVTVKFSPYPTIAYYQRFSRLLGGRITWQEYATQFDSLVADNYRAAELINSTTSEPQRLFIWGTNPMLYAQTNTYPTGRFLVSFHIKDFDAYEETMNDVKKQAPKFVVVMKNETTPLPGLNEYLASDYVLNDTFEHFEVWKKSNSHK
jgi:hypothetical protein